MCKNKSEQYFCKKFCHCLGCEFLEYYKFFTNIWNVFLTGRSIGTDNICRDRLEKTIILFTKVVSFFFDLKYVFSNEMYILRFRKENDFLISIHFHFSVKVTYFLTVYKKAKKTPKPLYLEVFRMHIKIKFIYHIS